MKESKAINVTDSQIKGNLRLRRDYQLYHNRIYNTKEYTLTNDVGIQFDSKREGDYGYKNFIRPNKFEQKRYFAPSKPASYRRSTLEVGVGSVKALQKRRVKKIYLPDTIDTGAGSDHVASYFNLRAKGKYRDRGRARERECYDTRRTSSKCVGGPAASGVAVVSVSAKLSPIIQTRSGATSPITAQNDSKDSRGTETGSCAAVGRNAVPTQYSDVIAEDRQRRTDATNSDAMAEDRQRRTYVTNSDAMAEDRQRRTYVTISDATTEDRQRRTDANISDATVGDRHRRTDANISDATVGDRHRRTDAKISDATVEDRQRKTDVNISDATVEDRQRKTDATISDAAAEDRQRKTDATISDATTEDRQRRTDATISKSQVSSTIKSSQKQSVTLSYKPSSKRKTNKVKENVSSDSLLQKVHEFDEPPAAASAAPDDAIENELEREYRKIFDVQSSHKTAEDESKLLKKSTSLFKRKFSALRKSMTKKESQQANESPSMKDASVTSDPPSLESRSFTSDRASSVKRKRRNQFRTAYKQTSHFRKASKTWSKAVNIDSEYGQGVKGMFKLWGKKFNFEEPTSQKEPPDSPDLKSSTGGNNSPKSSFESKPTEKGEPVTIKSIKEIIGDAPSMEKDSKDTKSKTNKRFFFFKKKLSKDKTKSPPAVYKSKKEAVTTNRCEVREGLTMQLRPKTPPQVTPSHHSRRMTSAHRNKSIRSIDNYEGLLKATWLMKFLNTRIESRNSVRVRWNNRMYYASSSSTVFELMEDVYKGNGLILNSQSEYTSHSSNISSNFYHSNAQFMQAFHAYMMPRMIHDRIKLPNKSSNNIVTMSRNKPGDSQMEVTISDQKWYIEKSKAFSNKIEVVLHKMHSHNLVRVRNPEMSYLRIDIPKGFFGERGSDNQRDHTSDEEVYKIVEYESEGSRNRFSKHPKVIPKVSNSGDYENEVTRLQRLKKTTDEGIRLKISIQNDPIPKTRTYDTIIKRPPMHRDVIIQGSRVYVPRSDVTGAGLVSQRDAALQIIEYATDDEEWNAKHKHKKVIHNCGFAKSFLRNDYMNWIPSSMDLFGWTASDSHIQCCSASCHGHYRSPATKSCPNIPEEYDTDRFSCNSCSTPEKKWNTEAMYKCNKESFTSKCSKEEGSGLNARILPKDSCEVFKTRKGRTDDRGNMFSKDEPYSVPSESSTGVQAHACGSVKKAGFVSFRCKEESDKESDLQGCDDDNKFKSPTTVCATSESLETRSNDGDNCNQSISRNTSDVYSDSRKEFSTDPTTPVSRLPTPGDSSPPYSQDSYHEVEYFCHKTESPCSPSKTAESLPPSHPDDPLVYVEDPSPTSTTSIPLKHASFDSFSKRNSKYLATPVKSSSPSSCQPRSDDHHNENPLLIKSSCSDEPAIYMRAEVHGEKPVKCIGVEGTKALKTKVNKPSLLKRLISPLKKAKQCTEVHDKMVAPCSSLEVSNNMDIKLALGARRETPPAVTGEQKSSQTYFIGSDLNNSCNCTPGSSSSSESNPDYIMDRSAHSDESIYLIEQECELEEPPLLNTYNLYQDSTQEIYDSRILIGKKKHDNVVNEGIKISVGKCNGKEEKNKAEDNACQTAVLGHNCRNPPSNNPSTCSGSGSGSGKMPLKSCLSPRKARCQEPVGLDLSAAPKHPRKTVAIAPNAKPEKPPVEKRVRLSNPEEECIRTSRSVSTDNCECPPCCAKCNTSPVADDDSSATPPNSICSPIPKPSPRLCTVCSSRDNCTDPLISNQNNLDSGKELQKIYQREPEHFDECYKHTTNPSIDTIHSAPLSNSNEHTPNPELPPGESPLCSSGNKNDTCWNVPTLHSHDNMDCGNELQNTYQSNREPKQCDGCKEPVSDAPLLNMNPSMPNPKSPPDQCLLCSNGIKNNRCLECATLSTQKNVESGDNLRNIQVNAVPVQSYECNKLSSDLVVQASHVIKSEQACEACEACEACFLEPPSDPCRSPRICLVNPQGSSSSLDKQVTATHSPSSGGNNDSPARYQYGDSLVSTDECSFLNGPIETAPLIDNLYKTSKVEQVATNVRKKQENIDENTSDASSSNVIEINFKLKVMQGDRTTEIKIGENDNSFDSKTKNTGDNVTNDVYMMNNTGPRENHVQKTNPDDVNIRILIKNLKSSKKAKRKNIIGDISDVTPKKYNNVSTEHCAALQDAYVDTCFSVHRTTVGVMQSFNQSNPVNCDKALSSAVILMCSKSLLAVKSSILKEICGVDVTVNSSFDATDTFFRRKSLPVIKKDEGIYESSNTHSLHLTHSSPTVSLAHESSTRRSILIKSSRSQKSSNLDKLSKSEDYTTTEKTSKGGYEEERKKVLKKVHKSTKRISFTDTDLSDTPELSFENTSSLPTATTTKTTDDQYTDNKTSDVQIDELGKVDDNYRIEPKTGERDTLEKSSDDDESVILEEIPSAEVTAKTLKEERKDMLRQVFEDGLYMKKPKNKKRIQKMKDLLKAILTSDSDPEPLRKYDSDYFNTCKSTDSLNNFYEDVVAPNGSKQLISDETDSMISINPELEKSKKCYCKQFSTKLFVSGPGCCCRKVVEKTDKEVTCNMSSLYAFTGLDGLSYWIPSVECVHVQTVNSRYKGSSGGTPLALDSKGNFLTSKESANFLKTKSMLAIDMANLQEDNSAEIEEQMEEQAEEQIDEQTDEQVSYSSKKFIKEITQIDMPDRDQTVYMQAESTTFTESKRSEAHTKQAMQIQNGADVLQMYETKKAVLEIYAEKTVTKDGEHFVAKLPKFVHTAEGCLYQSFEKVEPSAWNRNYVLMHIAR